MPVGHAEARNIVFPEFLFVSQKEPPRYIEISTKPVPGTLQEGGASFQTTHWTVVLQAGKAEADESARKALAISAKPIGRRFTHSSGVVAIRRRMRRIWCKVSSRIC